MYEYSLTNYILYTTQLSIVYTFGLFSDISGVHFRECDNSSWDQNNKFCYCVMPTILDKRQTRWNCIDF